MAAAPISTQSAPVMTDAKRAALDAVLTSATFSRSEQLRQFLKFVCDREIEGRADSITEYAIGVEALGRPSSFAPTSESAVRTRAHALRAKLLEYYQNEGASAEIRIDLPKGSYVPRFYSVGAAAESPRHEPVPPQYRYLWIATLLAGIVIGAVAVWGVARKHTEVPEVVRQAWGPLLRSPDEVLVCVSAPAHLLIQGVPPGAAPARAHRLPDSDALAPQVLDVFPQLKGSDLTAELSANSVRLGEALGALEAARVLGQAGIPYQTSPIKSIAWPVMAVRNLMVFGTPTFSLTAVRLLGGAPFQIAFDQAIGDVVVKSANATFAPRRDARSFPTESYGLITVRPSEGSADGSRRTVVISGATSAGAQAAMVFYSTPRLLEPLRARFGGAFPPAWQVVVWCSTEQDRLLETGYTAHAVWSEFKQPAHDRR